MVAVLCYARTDVQKICANQPHKDAEWINKKPMKRILTCKLKTMNNENINNKKNPSKDD